MKKKFRITLNGNSYEVVAEVLDEEGAPAASETGGGRRARSAGAGAVAAPAAKTAPAAGGAGGDLPSPLAGKVVSLDVSVGQNVVAGQKVMTLEAMKMNTVVTSHGNGTVQAILVSPGDSVEEGQSLLTIQ